MLWSKLKNVILAVLLLTNLFLLALVLSERVVGDSQELEARAMAIAFLEGQGMLVEEEKVPKVMDLAIQQLEWNREQEQWLVENIVGLVKKETVGEVVEYTNEKGTFRFYGNGDFHGLFHSQEFHQGELELAEHGGKILTELGIEHQYLGEEAQGAGTKVVYVQLLEGVPLLDWEIHLYYEEGVLQSIPQGRRVLGALTEREERGISVATALMQFYYHFGNLCQEVREVSLCYQVSMPMSGSWLVIPVWKFETDTGEYYVNGLSGKSMVEHDG